MTSFLPTAVSAPISTLTGSPSGSETWLPDAPTDGAEPLGLNLEGPFLPARAVAPTTRPPAPPADVTHD